MPKRSAARLPTGSPSPPQKRPKKEPHEYSEKPKAVQSREAVNNMNDEELANYRERKAVNESRNRLKRRLKETQGWDQLSEEQQEEQIANGLTTIANKRFVNHDQQTVPSLLISL
jgi:hypothetical protein